VRAVLRFVVFLPVSRLGSLMMPWSLHPLVYTLQGDSFGLFSPISILAENEQSI